MTRLHEVQNLLIETVAGLNKIQQDNSMKKLEEIHQVLQRRFFLTTTEGQLSSGTAFAQGACSIIGAVAGNSQLGKICTAVAPVLPQVNNFGQSQLRAKGIEPHFKEQEYLQKAADQSEKKRALSGLRDSVQQKSSEIAEKDSRRWMNAKVSM